MSLMKSIEANRAFARIAVVVTLALVGVFIFKRHLVRYLSSENYLNQSRLDLFEKSFPDLVPGGYFWPIQITQGESTQLYLHRAIPGARLRVFRSVPGAEDEFSHSLQTEKRPENSLDLCSVHKGCDWRANAVVETTADWTPGMYHLRWKQHTAYFFVLPKDIQRTQKEKALYIFDLNTFAAYNFYGGGQAYYELESCFQIYTSLVKKRGACFWRPNLVEFSFRRPLIPFNIFPDSEFKQKKPEHYMFWRNQFASEMLVETAVNRELDRTLSRYKNQYKFLILEGLQEYMSLDELEAIRDYVKGGGHLIHASSELGLKLIRQTDLGSFHYYWYPDHDPYFQKRKREVTGFSGWYIDLENFFGVNTEHGLGLTESTHKLKWDYVNKEHPLLKGVVDADGELRIGTVAAWAPATVLKESQGRFCFQTVPIDCQNLEILAFQEIHSKELKTDCCAWQKELDLAYEGQINHTLKEVPETSHLPLMHFKLGKGSVTYIPNDLFVYKPDKAKRFLKNLQEFVSQK